LEHLSPSADGASTLPPNVWNGKDDGMHQRCMDDCQLFWMEMPLNNIDGYNILNKFVYKCSFGLIFLLYFVQANDLYRFRASSDP
jgi:hypothetical protein